MAVGQVHTRDGGNVPAGCDIQIEVVYAHNGRKIRPDGLITVSFGKSTWSTFVEVKTGDNTLNADQINEC